jgi:hypothetical protein
MMLLEHRGTVKTAKELMEMCGDMDKDKNHRITFVEWCCAMFHKNYDELFNFVDEEARERAMEEAMRFGEEAKQAEEEIARANRQKELQAQLRAAALERESKLTGVAGMKAFFARKVEVTKTNEQQVRKSYHYYIANVIILLIIIILTTASLRSKKKRLEERHCEMRNSE